MAVVAQRRPKPPRTSPLSARSRRRSELTTGDRTIRAVLLVAAVIPTLVLAFIAAWMVKEAIPAIRFNGWSFFTTKTFSAGNAYGAVQVRNGQKAPAGAAFGVLPLLFGTFVSSLIALVLAVPVAVGGAILLVEKMPARFQGPLGTFLEILAGIPSVVFGLWGVYALGPLLSRTVYKWIASLGIPWLRGPTGSGQGLLTASIVLGIMIIPIVAATSRELVRSVPAISKEGAVSLALTPAETVRYVTVPYVRTGIIAAAILGWARALGETIAVLLISGNALNIYPHSIFAPFSSMAATIAAFIDTALGDPTGMVLSALAEVGLVLLFISIVTNFAGRMLTQRYSAAGLPVGRGV